MLNKYIYIIGPNYQGAVLSLPFILDVVRTFQRWGALLHKAMSCYCTAVCFQESFCLSPVESMVQPIYQTKKTIQS